VVMPFAFYRVSVFRGSDVALMGSRSAATPGQKLGPLPPGEIPPAKRIHSSAYKEEFRQFSEDDKRVIRKTIGELLEASLPHTLMGLGFVVE
ncbi:MAG TPA: hypothetical protein VNP36_11095, partial [Burkholderiales bacterium]|nr:hypothetical protein [Burkholderiales bacterium]